MIMRLLNLWRDGPSGHWLAKTDQVHWLVHIPDGVVTAYHDARNRDLAVLGYLLVFFEILRKNAMIRAGRHDHFKGFRA